MPGIDKIILRNFKAFPVEEILELNGKHILIYGENGSGKSSIYWALYTLLQAQGRGEGTKKYFTKGHAENLLNIHAKVDDLSFIKVSLIDEPEVFYRVDKDGITIENESSKTEDVLDSLNRNSDFISHRLLINFYNFRNSKDIDLWPVFERDIIPFLKNKKGDGAITLNKVFEELDKNRPLRLLENGTIENQSTKKEYLEKILSFNTDLDYWINEINAEINDFYMDNFHGAEDEELKIELSFIEQDYLQYSAVKQVRVVANSKPYTYKSKDLRDLIPPVIRLSIKVKKSEDNWELIKRPQSYLNEAKLTAIALSVRFSLLQDTIRVNYPGKILALDDLLISLDMSNRDKVLDLILNKYAKDDKYKVYLFTHDKAFFNMAKNRINHKFEKDKWLIKSIYSTNGKIRKPKIYESSDNISIAREYITQRHDYPAAANYLRKEAENILTQNLPKEILKNIDGSNKTKLNEYINAAKPFLQNLHLDFSNLNELSEFVDTLLNPLSHDDIDSEAYYYELMKTMKILELLRDELMKISEKLKKVNGRDTEFSLKIRKNDTTINVYNIKLKQDLYHLQALNGESNKLSKCEIARDITCYEILNGTDGKTQSFQAAIDQCVDFKEFYEGCANADNIPLLPDYLSLFLRKSDSMSLEQILNNN